MRKVKLSLVLFILLLFIPCAHAQNVPPAQPKAEPLAPPGFESDQDQVALPLGYGRGLLFTDAVKINGKTVGYMVIDSGSNVTLLDTKLIQELGLKPFGQGSANGRVMGMACVVDTFALGPLVLRRHAVVATDLAAFQGFSKPIVGLLGRDVFGRVPFTVDYSIPALVLHNPARFVPPKDASAFDLLLDSALSSGPATPGDVNPPHVAGTLDGRKVVFLLDTGCSEVANVPPSISAASPKAIGAAITAASTSLAAPTAAQFKFHVDELTVLGKTWRNPPNVLTTDLPLVAPTGDRPDDVVLGSKVLRHYRLTIDYARRKVWTSPAPSIPDRLKSGLLKPDSVDIAGLSPLAEAALDGDLDAFTVLLQAGASVGFIDAQGQTMLHLALRGDNAAIVSAVLAQPGRPDVNAQTKEGVTALMIAAALNAPQLVAEIVKSSADPNLLTHSGESALSYAVDAQSTEVVKLLLAKSAKVDLFLADGTTPLSRSASKGAGDVFDLLLQAGAGLDMKTRDGSNLLHCAAYGGNPDVLQSVLKLKPDLPVDSKTQQGWTPLMIASQMGRAPAVEVLLKAGADPNLATPPADNAVSGENSLHLAASGGSDDVVKLLLAHGVAVDSRTTDGLTPLMLAAGLGRPKALDALLAAHADVNAADKEGASVLYYAVKFRQPSLLPTLLHAGAKVDAPDSKGVRPLDVAAILGDVDSARILVEAGADPEAPGKHGSSAIDLARAYNHPELANLLKSRFAPP